MIKKIAKKCSWLHNKFVKLYCHLVSSKEAQLRLPWVWTYLPKFQATILMFVSYYYVSSTMLKNGKHSFPEIPIAMAPLTEAAQSAHHHHKQQHNQQPLTVNTLLHSQRFWSMQP